MGGKHTPMIPLSGGPCGGKSKFKEYALERLSELGIQPLVVPERASYLSVAGVDIAEFMQNSATAYALQKEILLQQIGAEEDFLRVAAIHPAQRTVVLPDRGTMDSAFFAGPRFGEIAEELGYEDIEELCNRRYGGVLHLVTAADGAEEFYNYDNPARRETPEEAREQDKKLQEIWMRHEHFRLVPNTEIVAGQPVRIDFSRKMERAVREVCNFAGIPAPLEIERKFVIKNCNPADIPAPKRCFYINQFYLYKRGNTERRIRSWRPVNAGGQQAELYTYTEKTEVRKGVRHEEERKISAQEFFTLMEERDPLLWRVSKHRFAFVWQGQYFQLDVFESPQFDTTPLVLLEIELTEETDEVRVPDFLKIEKEVTDDSRYKNYGIASGECPVPVL